MAAEAAADDAQRNAERKIVGRIVMLKEIQYLKAKCHREEGYSWKRRLGTSYRWGVWMVSLQG